MKRHEGTRIFLKVLLLALIAVGLFGIDIPCGADPWPPCDLNPPGTGGGGNVIYGASVLVLMPVVALAYMIYRRIRGH